MVPCHGAFILFNMGCIYQLMSREFATFILVFVYLALDLIFSMSFFQGWWNNLLRENSYKELDYSGKMVLLLDILTMSSDVGDKALVFSQSIPTLDLIELYLSKLSRPGRKGKLWKKGKDWYR